MCVGWVGVASLPTDLHRNYVHLRELDRQFQTLQKHMQQQCAKGVDDVMKAVESGTNAPDSIALHHSNEIINAHKACLSIADEKVSLALKTYDLVWWRWSSLQNSKSSLISNSSCQVLLMGILTTCSSILYSCSSVVLE